MRRGWAKDVVVRWMVGLARVLAICGPAAADDVCRVWQDRTYEVPFPRANGEIVYDSWRGVIVFVGGGETWEWGGEAWTQRLEPGPSARYGSLVFDEARGVSVYFAAPETWEWDGVGWQLRDSAGPTGGWATFDSSQNKVLLLEYGRGLWHWDGSVWTQSSAPAVPMGVQGILFDRSRQLLLSFTESEVWEWDGVSWKIGGPFPDDFVPAAGIYDSARNVALFVSYDGRSCEWDGLAWQAFPVLSDWNTAWRYIPYFALTYDSRRGATVSFRAADYTGFDAGMWDRIGTEWRLRAISEPAPRVFNALTYDEARGNVVMFGGRRGSETGDTWTWDGQTWQFRTLLGPSPRQKSAMVYDSAREVVVLFGGQGYEYEDVTAHCCALDGTYEWDGSAWNQLEVAGPGKRHSHAMVYDAARGVTVLFGGYFQAGSVEVDHPWGDTWIWDGIQWTELMVDGPPPVSRPMMAYDARREVTVLFSTSGSWEDSDSKTWEWDGTAWRECPGQSPPIQSPIGMYYDAARARTVLIGVHYGEWAATNETWEWNGLSWRYESGPVYTFSLNGTLAYDGANQSAVMFGGLGPRGSVNETWEYSIGEQPADCDADCDVDLLDFAVLQACMGESSAGPDCASLDADGSGWIDAGDFAELLAAPTGPTQP